VIPDHQTLIVNLTGKGLVVLDPCGHAGVVSSLLHAQKITGVNRVHALLGGFHLGHADIPEEKIRKTVAALKDLNVMVVSPMHCSGFRATSMVGIEMPDRLRVMSVGTVVTFEGDGLPG
jgi:7,8-dihydropterin-6-yl-methyl-4-(beta-D-ribofuranosyl)aminobenzene 5'-phosphate synthase